MLRVPALLEAVTVGRDVWSSSISPLGFGRRRGSRFLQRSGIRGKPDMQCLGAQLRGLVIGAASGAAGRAYSALDDFVEFHRG